MIYVMPKKTMWKELEDALTAELEFKDFAEAFAFMTDVAALAEEHDHHPEWSNVYRNIITVRFLAISFSLDITVHLIADMLNSTNTKP